MTIHPVTVWDIRGAASALADIVVRTAVFKDMDANAPQSLWDGA